MKKTQCRPIAAGLVLGILLFGLAACGGVPFAASEPTPTRTRPTATAGTAQPTTTATAEPTSAAIGAIERGISGIGEVKAIQDADIVFNATGTVEEVLVEEGDSVQEDDLLARLDPRPFEERIRQAESSLADALARQAALNEPPKSYDVAAAQARIAEAEAALAELKAGPKAQDVQDARSRVDQARVNLQTQRNQLSVAKNDAELRIEPAANQVRDLQAEYSRIYWENRELENELARGGDELPQERKDMEQQALRAVESAEEQLEQAKLAFEQAQLAEITGIQEAEERVVQAEAALEKLLLPPDPDDLAAAESRLVQAQADLNRLYPNPTASEVAQAAAAVEQARSQLEVARLDREYTELRAPFDGVVTVVNIDPGDPSSAGGGSALRVVDISELRIEVDISDVDIAQVEVGQEARIFVDAFPGEVFSGEVSYIAPSATVSGSVRTYEVRIALDDPDKLRDGMSARVELLPAE
jgi:HlyD family secretion protein